MIKIRNEQAISPQTLQAFKEQGNPMNKFMFINMTTSKNQANSSKPTNNQNSIKMKQTI